MPVSPPGSDPANVDGASLISVGTVEFSKKVLAPAGGGISSLSALEDGAVAEAPGLMAWLVDGGGATRAGTARKTTRGNTVAGLPSGLEPRKLSSCSRRAEGSTGAGAGRPSGGPAGSEPGGPESDPAADRRGRSAGSEYLGCRRPGPRLSSGGRSEAPVVGSVSGREIQAGIRPWSWLICSRHLRRPRRAI